MVRGRHRRERAEARHALEDLPGHDGMLANLGELGLRERAGLVEDPVGERELAHVVQQRRPAEIAALGCAGAHRPSEGDHDHREAIGMPVGPGRLGIDDACEGVGDPVEGRIIGRQQAIAWLPRRHIGLCQRSPERRVVTDRPQRLDERRIEPSAAAPLGHPAGSACAAGGVEDLRRLRETQQTPQQRNLLAAQPSRLAITVPVLVECADGLGRLALEPEQVGDLGATVTTRLHQRARHLPFVLDRTQPVDPRAGGATRGDGAQRPDERRELPRPVHALGRALGHMVVRAEQRRHPG